MKNLIYSLVAFLLVGSTAFASTTTSDISVEHNRFVRSYGNSFIFVEQGIEFAVFPDGQFDFNVDNYGPDFGAYANLGGVAISFNTGYGYDAYVQYDDFGAVIQVENVPIYYDYYGRIIQAGNVHIRYNNYGYVSRVGGLWVHYSRPRVFSHCTGFINIWNRNYIFRPWHTYYVIPRTNFCILFNRPYRRWYTPIRHTYYRPYRDNFRPSVNYSYNRNRRGNNNTVARNNSRRSDFYRQDATVSRRDGSQNNTIGRNDGRRDTAISSSTGRRDGNQRGAPTTINKRDEKLKRSKRTVQRGAPTTTSERGGPKFKRNEKKRDSRVTQMRPKERKTNAQRKRVNNSNKRKTVVQKRDVRSSKKRTVTQRSNKSSNKSRATKKRSSSKKQTPTRRSRQ